MFDEIFLAHDTGEHPEHSSRLEAIRSRLMAYDLWDTLTAIPARPAEFDDIAAIHDPQYIQTVERLAQQGGGKLDIETIVSARSYDAALMAAGGCLAAGDAVCEGEIRNAFCMVRPPGHHARPDGGMGFCLFNNIAVLARYLQNRHDMGKILIIDWDVHHGNGTQQAFYDDPTVFFYSIHRWPWYPGGGTAAEKGKKAGLSSTLNIPLPKETTREEYLIAFENGLRQAAEKCRPNFVLISAGFDAYHCDPVGGLNLEHRDFALLTELVMQTADTYCEGRIVSVLEGGYALPDLGISVAEHVRTLSTLGG